MCVFKYLQLEKLIYHKLCIYKAVLHDESSRAFSNLQLEKMIYYKLCSPFSMMNLHVLYQISI